MADEKPPGFWKRLKDRLLGVAEAATRQALPSKGRDGANSVLSTSELKTDTVGRVYAEALLELAREQGVVDALTDEVQQLLPVIAEGGELNRLLTNPAIGDAERAKIVERVFSGKVSDLLYKMMRVLCDKGRLGSLSQVAAGYLLAVSDDRGHIDVEAYIASELDSDAAKKVAEQIGQALGKTVTLTQKVDESLIGGLKIKVGDQLIDASVASQLRSMKNKMIAAGRA
ncbi:MAG: ATP synthase F1 subunit delta [Phycisphaeraceae bacterium]|nr:ATP synthase F1 subunit delta [Phycisphaeraceae bacterium]